MAPIPSSPFRTVVARLAKAGLDPTEAVAQGVAPQARRCWRKSSEAALAALLAELAAARDRDEGQAAAGAQGPAGARLRGLLVAAILADFAARLAAPFTPDEQDVARAAAVELLGQGAAGLGLDLDGAGGPFTEALAAAERDLLGVLVGRLDAIRPEVEAIVRRGVAGELAPAQVELELRALLDPTGLSWISRAVGDWAFRWRNVGAVMTARQAGISTLRVVNNPPRGPDARTTPFCRWMHGRTIDVFQAAAQIGRYQQAVLAGDWSGARAAWPLLDRSRLSDPAAFGLVQATAGLPPYHFGCRDKLEVA